MTSPPEPAHGHVADGCAELRAAVDEACTGAHAAKEAHTAAAEHIRTLRRDLTTAQHELERARAAADPARRGAEKAAAYDAYRLARLSADDEGALRAATATYARAIDHANRTARLTERGVHKAATRVEALGNAYRAAEREEQATRLRADQAVAACLDARVRLAACEEGTVVTDKDEHATVFEPHAATGGHAVAISSSASGPPLVIESMVSGDRVALELTSARLAEHIGLSAGEAMLQLQELVDAIIAAASAAGYLVFDTRNPFWSALTFEEARDVIAALDRLGFVFEPATGWHAGRAPSPSDLSMALAYAGLDARNMRGLPTSDELRALPGSIGVDARAFLAANAPELTVDHVVRSLDARRAEQLEPLWNEWGQVRPVLLMDRHALGSVPG